MSPEIPPTGAGERSPRSRILSSAAELFYWQGINATGVAEVSARAGVSKRTLYQIFPSKDALVAAYLRTADGAPLGNEAALSRPDLSGREQLLALFDRPVLEGRYRGCPFHNAAVELTAPESPAWPVILEHKHRFLRRVIAAARRAGAGDPDDLGGQIAVLFEGAMALSTSLNSTEPFDFARGAAQALTDLSAARRSGRSDLAGTMPDRE